MRPYKSTPFERRKNRVRQSVRNQDKPRLSVFRSGKYTYAQIIDDKKGHTLASSSSMEKAFIPVAKGNCEAATWVGNRIAEIALGLGIQHVVFDRGAYRFHGRVKALADAARQKGLSF